MKTITKLFLILISSTLAFSCNKKEEETPSPVYFHTTTKQAYEKKWTVTSALRVDGTTSTPAITAIEFLLDTYVVFYSNDSTVTNGYTKVDAQTLSLNTFGTLNIVAINATNFNFVLSQPGKSDVTINSTPATLLSSTPNTIALSNTWKTQLTTSTDPSRVPNYNSSTSAEKFYISLSQFGTFCTKTISENGSTEYTKGVWSWSDANENAISLDQGYGPTISNLSFQNSNAQITLVVTIEPEDGKPACTVTNVLAVQ